MCSKIVFLFVFVYFVSYYSNAQRYQYFYKKDYKYVSDLESFYKIHKTHTTWTDADKACAAEDANLFYPRGTRDALEFMNVLSFFNGESTSWTENGISYLITKAAVNEKFEGIPISELYDNWGPSDNSKYPFICKKTRDSFEWNEECSLPIPDFKYSVKTGRCYKFHLDPRNWTDAYDICNQEQSYLAVINSPTEASVLAKLAQNALKENIDGDYVSGIAHLGFRNKDKEGWKTIDGVNLEDSGYPQWNRGQPDGPRRGVEELCGSMFYVGELNDIGCHVRSFFICEHEIEPILSLRGHRLSKV